MEDCRDYYSQKLTIGDEVTPVMSEALMMGIEGFISKIEYSEKFKEHFITIVDENNDILLKNINSKYYTTVKRKEERAADYEYYLSLYNDNFFPKDILPLTTVTNANFEVPENINFIQLEAKNIIRRNKNNEVVQQDYTVFYLINDNHFDIIKKDENIYLFNKKEWYQINENYKIFKNKKEFNRCIRCVIEYFNDVNIINTNKNNEKADFEKKLVHKLTL